MPCYWHVDVNKATKCKANGMIVVVTGVASIDWTTNYADDSQRWSKPA